MPDGGFEAPQDPIQHPQPRTDRNIGLRHDGGGSSPLRGPLALFLATADICFVTSIELVLDGGIAQV